MIWQSVHIIDYPLMDIAKDSLKAQLLRDINHNYPIVGHLTEAKHIFDMRVLYAQDAESQYEYKYEVIISNEEYEKIQEDKPHLFL